MDASAGVFAVGASFVLLRQLYITRNKVRAWSTRPKNLDFRVDGNDASKRDAGMKHVVRHLVDGWDEEMDIDVKTIQGGLTNQLYLLSLADGTGALVRLYGLNTEKLIKREDECIIFHVLSEKGFAPKLLGTFKNGRVEEYVVSVGINPDEMGSTKYQGIIASELATMHDIHMPGSKRPSMWNFFKKFKSIAFSLEFQSDPVAQKILEELDLPSLQVVLDDLENHLPSARNHFGKAFIKKASDEGERLAMKFLFKSVFCHNDLLAGNLLYMENTQKIQIIDFEYGKYNFRGFDIANHFCEYAGFDFNLEKYYPSPVSQRKFLNSYIYAPDIVSEDVLSLRAKLQADSELNDAFMRECIRWIDRFTLGSHFLWGLWAVIQKEYSPIDFDYLGYAQLRLKNIPKEKF